MTDDPREKVTTLAMARLLRAQTLTVELAEHDSRCHACWSTEEKCVDGAVLWQAEQAAWAALEKTP